MGTIIPPLGTTKARSSGSSFPMTPFLLSLTWTQKEDESVTQHLRNSSYTLYIESVWNLSQPPCQLYRPIRFVPIWRFIPSVINHWEFQFVLQTAPTWQSHYPVTQKPATTVAQFSPPCLQIKASHLHKCDAQWRPMAFHAASTLTLQHALQ